MTISEAELIDRAEIGDALVAYSQAQDQNEWWLWERVFTSEATIDFPGMGMPTMAARAFRDFLITHNETRISGQHLVANTLFQFDGASAHVVSEAIYITLHPTETPGLVRRVRGNALYVDDFVLTDDGWRIRHRTIAQKNVEIDEGRYDSDLLDAIRNGAATRWLRPADAVA